MRVLAFSSSRVGGGAYLASAVPLIYQFLGSAPLRLAFVPFASVDNDYEAYAEKVREGLASLPYSVHVVTPGDGKRIIEESEVIMVGGGNTFKLLHDVYEQDLYSLIKQKVQAGTPYIGWSAGSNLTGKSICTTNDMPIIQPQSFTAFNFLPFQINPHYYNVVIEGFHGETRDQRLTEFLLLNPGVPVVGLPEGTALQLMNGKLLFLGEQKGVLFQNSRHQMQPVIKEVLPADDLSFLL